MTELTSQTAEKTPEVLLAVGFVDTDEEDIVESDGFEGRLLEILESHGGRVKGNVDGVYVVGFVSAREAIGYAVAVQGKLTDIPGGYRTKFGIDVSSLPSVYGENVCPLPADASDGARRLMRVADAGQILISRIPFDEARGQDELKADSAALVWLAHGAYLFEGIDEPIEIFEAGAPGTSTLERPSNSEQAKRATALTDEPTLGWRPAVGQRIPGKETWILQEKIGEGGFGEVWVAEGEETHELRAYKFCFKAERLRALKRERTLFRLMQEALGERKDIAPLFDVRLDEAPYYLELEYTNGGDLEAWAEKQGGIENVALEQRLDILVRIAEALNAANSIGVLHKDIKPRNILIEEAEDGSILPKLTDFGIGQLVDRTALRKPGAGGSGFTTDGTTMQTELGSQTGTRVYMAPELLAGKAPSIQSDVYALGVLLYQLVVGDFARPPGQGWQRDIKDDLLVEDIASCIDMEPERRLASAGELAQRLRGLEERRAKRNANAEAKAGADRGRRRRKLYVTTSVVAALVALVAGGLAIQQSRLRAQAEDAEKIAEVEREHALARAEEARQAKEQADAEAERAKKEERVAKSVEGFLVDLFRYSSPSDTPHSHDTNQLTATRGESVTIREILDAGARKIETSLEDEPEVRARLMDALGMVYNSLHEHGKARSLVEEALQIRRDLYGESHEEIARGLRSLAYVREDNQEMDESRTLFEDALFMRRALYDGDHDSVAESLTDLGHSFVQIDDRESALRNFLEAYDLERRLHEGNHLHIARALRNLSASTPVNGDPKASTPFRLGALELYRKLGVDDIKVAVILHQQGHAEEALGNYEQAVERYEGALTAYRRAQAINPDLKGVLNIPHDLVRMFQRLERYDEAEAHSREAVRLLRESNGDQNGSLAHGLTVLGQILNDKGDIAEAEKVFRDVIAFGQEYDNGARLELSKLMRIQGQWEAAEEILLIGLALDREVLGDNNAELSGNYVELTNFYLSRNDINRAEKAFRKVIPHDITNHLAIRNVTRALSRIGPIDKAEAFVVDVLAATMASLGSNHPRYGFYRNILGEVLRHKGDLSGAEKAFREAIRLEPWRFSGSDNSHHNLANVLADSGDHSSAVELMQDRLSFDRERFGAGSDRLAPAIKQLAHLLLKTGDYEALASVLVQWSDLGLGEHSDFQDLSFLHLYRRTAASHQLRGDFDKAEEWWRRYVRALREQRGDDYPGVGPALRKLATMVSAMGRPSEAAGLVREASTIGLEEKAKVNSAQDSLFTDRPDLVGYRSGMVNATQANAHLDIWREGNGYIAVFSQVTTVATQGFTYGSGMIFSEQYQPARKVTASRTLQEDKSIVTRWRTDNGETGEGIYSWVDPASVPIISSDTLSGEYAGQAGYPDHKKVDVQVRLRAVDDNITGTVTLPLGILEVVHGKFLPANRVFLKLKGDGVEGLMMGTASEQRLEFLYEIGFGTGEAHLIRTTPNGV
jgi:serine/threonine protein kinase